MSAKPRLHSDAMRCALQCHYKRCQLYHTWERLLAASVEHTATRGSTGETAGFAAHLNAAVVQPLQAINVQLRQSQMAVKGEAEPSDSPADGGTEDSGQTSACRFFVRWVDSIQEAERQHFSLMAELGTEVAAHISAGFLKGYQCQACLLRAKAEWNAYATEVVAQQEEFRRKKFLEEIRETAHQHSAHCHGDEENESTRAPDSTERHDSDRTPDTWSLPPPPLPPKDRDCPHLSVHDLHSCVAYRLLMLQWGGQRQTILGGNEEEAHSAEEEVRRRRRAEEDNPWLARLRHVQCEEYPSAVQEVDSRSSSSNDDAGEAIQGSDKEDYMALVYQKFSSPLVTSQPIPPIAAHQSITGTSAEVRRPPFPTCLPDEQLPIFRLGDEREGAEELSEMQHQQASLRHQQSSQKTSPLTTRDRLKQLKKRDGVEDEEDSDLQCGAVMASCDPREVHQRCRAASQNLERILAAKRNIEEAISDLVEELQCQLYDTLG